MLAHHGLGLAQAAEAGGVALKFEAAVAGGIPIVKTLREGLAGNAIDRVYGILNGTCNYILSRMEAEKLSFEACLAEAQRLGYAEADPTFDIGGFDTAHKLAILTSLAFGTAVDADAVGVEGIEAITLADLQAAEDLGYRVKLLGVAKRTSSGIEQRVHPTMVPKQSAIAQAMGVSTNAVVVNADAVREVTLSGPGAGGMATASAVVADIADVAKGDLTPAFGLPCRVARAAGTGGDRDARGRLLRTARPLRRAGRRRRHRHAHGREGHLAGKHRPARARPSGVVSGTPVPVTFITHAPRPSGRSARPSPPWSRTGTSRKNRR